VGSGGDPKPRDSCIPGIIDKLELGGVIFDARDGLGMSKAVLAEKIGISVSTIDQWEIGGAAPLLSKLDKLLDIFDLDAESVLTFVGSPIATRCVLTALGRVTPPMIRKSMFRGWSKEVWLEFAQQVKAAREDIRASRRLISKALDINMGTLTAIERGLFKAGVERGYKLAWLFGIDISR